MLCGSDTVLVHVHCCSLAAVQFGFAEIAVLNDFQDELPNVLPDLRRYVDSAPSAAVRTCNCAVAIANEVGEGGEFKQRLLLVVFQTGASQCICYSCLKSHSLGSRKSIDIMFSQHFVAIAHCCAF